MKLLYPARPLLFSALLFMLHTTLSAQIFTVTSTGDAGAGTLRQAILNLNAFAGAGPYEIRFAIGAAGSAQTITVTGTAFADINKSNVLIDGRSQGTAVCNPLITINFGGTFRGFRTIAGMNNISFVGLVMQNVDRAITFQGGTGHSVKGCYFGLTSNGSAAATVTAGVLDAITFDGSSNCVIGGTNICDRNLICGWRHGIYMINTGSNYAIYNNFIGLAKDGSTIVANQQDGIRADNNITNITIGGNGSFERNIISGNGFNGINMNATGNTGCIITNNYIGLDSTGMIAKSNGSSATSGTYAGIVVNGTGTIVQNNVVAGDGFTFNNYVYAIHFAAGNNHQLLNDIVGLNRTGIANATNFGSFDDGVRFTGVSSGHTVTGNIVCNSGNGQANTGAGAAPNAGRGIVFMGNITSVTITANKLGVDITGNTAKGNYEHGLFFNSNATNVTVGGATIAERNYIGGNGYRNGSTANLRHGIGAVAAGVLTNVTITNNFIGLGADGVTDVGNSNFGMGLQGMVSCTISNNYSCYNRVGLFMAGCGSTLANGNTIINNTFSYNNDPTANCAGIVLQQNSDFNKILNNVITYNKQGIWLRAQTPPTTQGDNDNNTIRGNTIAYNTGTGGAPYTAQEASGNGIVISGLCNRNYIGGPFAADDNIIHSNGGAGIYIVDVGSTENKIRRNSIYCNGGKGIDLNATANGNKMDPGPYIDPTLTPPNLIATTGGNTATDTVEVFWDNACGDCEGKTYLGLAVVTGAGQWNYSVPPNAPLPATTNLTVRGTANTNSLYANTSEFSSCTGLFSPVNLSFFKAYEVGADVKLVWVTQSEENNSHFIIQRSKDKEQWEEIATVQGAGTTTEKTDYIYVDHNPGAGIFYYRLVQVDFDGTKSNSQIESVSFSETLKFLIYPNPFSENVKIVPAGMIEGEIQAEIFDVTGKLIFSNSYAGNSEEIVLGNDLSEGMYLLKIKFENQVQVVKLIKENK
ncbi:MAG: T9SS type A sorting domain-containing protein [Cytophagaceae bacterium]|nr:T9SS type A sorting domain-containing protein [Cytophagaceae bacterium]